MFLSRGKFLDRTFTNKEISTSLPANVERFAGIKQTSHRHIQVCAHCCKELFTYEEETKTTYFHGYLTHAEYRKYRVCAKQADELHTNGYTLVSRNRLNSCHFPLDLLLDMCYMDRKNISKLRNGGHVRDKKRSWLQFDTTHWAKDKRLIKHWQKVGGQMTVIINPDIHFGRLAIANRDKMMGTVYSVRHDQSVYVPKDLSILYKALGLVSYQEPHADAHHGCYNVIEPLTNNYKLKLFPKSHLLPFWDAQNREHISGYGKLETMNRGMVLLFHSNLVHNGVDSCQIKNNFDTLREQFTGIDRDKFEKINWFGGGRSAEGLVLTDMSLHYTLNPAFGRMSEGDFRGGRVEVFGAEWLNPKPSACDRSTDASYNVERKKKMKEYKEKIQRGLKDYISMKMPGEASERKPCGSVILDVDSALRTCNGQQPTSTTRNRRKRRHIQYQM